MLLYYTIIINILYNILLLYFQILFKVLVVLFCFWAFLL